MLQVTDKLATAYIVGVAMGDGNLSNPNGRAVRLRITCDLKYPNLITKIERNLQKIAPNNKVSRINRKDCKAIDLSCYSNDWEKVLGWKSKGGSKAFQKISIPKWITRNENYSRACLCGLFETDGSIYKDRKYLTVNFVTQIPELAKSFEKILKTTEFEFSCQVLQLENDGRKFTFRIHKNSQEFIQYLGINKT